MPITFLNLAMLAGLAAVLIPPVIHLLNRRRFDVVPWGAMQFLEVSRRTRRRIFLEEVVLMLARMGVVALMVVALAAPVDASRWLDVFADRGTREIVVVVDGSASMGYRGPNGTAHDAVKQWVAKLLDELSPGDGVAVIHARQRPTTIVARPTHDFDAIRTAVHTLSPPRGGCDGPAAVQTALQVLDASTAARREVVVLTDGQRHGWADDAAMSGWQVIGRKSKDDAPRVWVVNLDADRPADAPNRSVAPLRASRAVASVGQQVTFHTAVRRHGTGQLSPLGPLRLFVNGKPAGDLPPPTETSDQGQAAVTIRHRFAAAGSHLVTVQTNPDALPADDRHDFALEVLPQLPVLLVDGDPNPSAYRRGADFLRDALAPARDPSPSVLVRVVNVDDFDPAVLTRDVAGPGTSPRVLALCNVARLRPDQEQAIAAFVSAGGGLLVGAGDRADVGHYDRELYRAGHGWLPARLVEAVGDLSDPTRGAAPQPASFYHPALELFREPQPGGLADARFPRYWRLAIPAGGPGNIVARLGGGDAFLAEKAVGNGRVLQSCAPLDNSWRTNLVELPAFAPLAHELIFYLAGARSAALNLAPGQPLRFRLPENAPTTGWSVRPPDGPERPVVVLDRQIASDDTTETGVYVLRQSAGDPVRYYVVRTDADESDLRSFTEADRDELRRHLPGLEFSADAATVVAGILRAPRPAELWWLCMATVVLLLAVEVWLTRRRAVAADAL